ncbi:MAG TPA: hypothetical protein VKU88_00055 [Acidimicrobiales bacterium]|nr:hypothetical protein [Acidimicrobiales bacterium]
MDASLFGLSQTQALVVLFVIAPFAVAAVVVPLVAWRHSGGPPPLRTSEILARGDPGRAEVVSVRNVGNLLDARPMVRFVLRVTSDPEPFELEVVQSLPRTAVRGFRPGDVVDVRLTPDRRAGAVVWSVEQY